MKLLDFYEGDVLKPFLVIMMHPLVICPEKAGLLVCIVKYSITPLKMHIIHLNDNLTQSPFSPFHYFQHRYVLIPLGEGMKNQRIKDPSEKSGVPLRSGSYVRLPEPGLIISGFYASVNFFYQSQIIRVSDDP